MVVMSVGPLRQGPQPTYSTIRRWDEPAWPPAAGPRPGGCSREGVSGCGAVCYTGGMARQRRTAPAPALPPRWYRGADVPMRVIRRFARQVAEQFAPDKIILFGSHAYGTPHEDSDVDILVIMPARNQIDQAIKIQGELEAPFPMDLIVRTPHNLGWRLNAGESFHTEIVTKGKVLYEKGCAGVGQEGRSRSSCRAATGKGKRPSA